VLWVLVLKVAVNFINVGPAKVEAANGPYQELDTQNDTKVTVRPSYIKMFASCHGLFWFI
jgi:hypothetical protein